jgi:hypothetical protein
MNNKALIVGLLVLVAAAAGLQWYHTRDEAKSSSPLDKVAEKLNLGMPKPYVNNLMMERVHVEDNRLVTDIHIPDIRLNQLDPNKIPIIHKQELGDLVEAACTDPEMLAVMKDKAKVARRFLDQDHKLIFEVAVSTSDCGPRALN